MSKRASKLFFGAALVGAAVAGGIAYLNKCKKENDSLDDDFDDFQDDFEDEDLEEEEGTPVSSSREYVTIPTEEKSEEEAENEPEETDEESTVSEETVTSEETSEEETSENQTEK